MEFTFSEFTGRLILNATDIILHLEDTKTARLYEQTFFDRDFPEVSQLGSLEFVSKLLTGAFIPGKAQPGIRVTLSQHTPASVSLTLTYTLPLLVKPIELLFVLPATRRQTGSPDVSDLAKKVKETDAKLPVIIEKLLEPLVSRIKELEERMGDFIVLPGCDYAIPTSLTSLKLVRSGTALMDNFYYSSAYPQMKLRANQQDVVGNPFTAHNNPYVTWQSDPGAFPVSGFSINNDKVIGICLVNLKYAKHITSLTIAGLPVTDADCDTLKNITGLTHLIIIGSRKVQTSPHTGQNMENTELSGTPTITHLNWITSLKNLQSLTLVGCKSLTDITALKDLPNLRELDIRETGVKNTDFLTNSSLKITK